MNKGVLILAGAVATGLAVFTGKKAVEKIKRSVANIDFGISFNRIHGLVGEGVARFLNPTVRVLVDLTLKNYSGFDLEAKKIFTRLETRLPSQADWSIIATQQGYLDINVANGAEKKNTLQIDVKGFAAIGNLTKKTTKCRAVVKYEFKGIELEYIKEIDVAAPIAAYWNKVKAQFPSLTGIAKPKNDLHLAA